MRASSRCQQEFYTDSYFITGGDIISKKYDVQTKGWFAQRDLTLCLSGVPRVAWPLRLMRKFLGTPVMGNTKNLV